MQDLLKDKSKQGKQNYTNFMLIDEQMSNAFIKRWLNRCKFKYCLAFMQWRTLSYNPNFRELESIFKSRLVQLVDAIKHGKKNNLIKD